MQTCYKLCSFHNIHTFFSSKHILVLLLTILLTILFIPHNIKIHIIYKCLGLCEIEFFLLNYLFNYIFLQKKMNYRKIVYVIIISYISNKD